MFELKSPTTVRLKHASARKQHHGEALVLALDLRLVWTTNNRNLDGPFPGLRDALFAALPVGAEEPDDDQTEMDLPVSETPFVRLAKLKYPVKWEDELTGYTVRQDYGLGGKSDKVLNVCVLKNFAVTPVEGGSVEIEYTVSSAADIDGEMVGAFMALIQQDIVITQLAPAAVQDGLIDASAGSGAPGTGPATETPKPEKSKSKAHKDATNAFIDAHAPADGAAAAH